MWVELITSSDAIDINQTNFFKLAYRFFECAYIQ